ncbi:hypothetical protein GGTG_00559 [Gaeumannomyces tritici R3-111a-1]|uniref:Uncharacterized protein n=1 Tax=Gaeumannomyces tritici (strain R3-111a-1) TaxID=644352 RepID=J3NH21_GAET3|nr:hypothetical protein GGTG_00559 [Gaeumannomyces tritici R3-111a-1]EJT80564.1 hypothetical protein GGTG_00559 [Gaeumannomyces tritici R3-111a-1]
MKASRLLHPELGPSWQVSIGKVGNPMPRASIGLWRSSAVPGGIAKSPHASRERNARTWEAPKISSNFKNLSLTVSQDKSP